MRELRVIPRPDQATPRQVRCIEAAFAVWTAGWIVMAVWTAGQIGHLYRWADLLDYTGGTVSHAAAALDGLRHVPAAGSLLGAASVQLRALANQAYYSAAQAGSAIDQLSEVIGLAIAAVPTVPAIAVLARFELQRRRERRALLAALAGHRREVALRYLAERAATTLPYRELVELGATSSDSPRAITDRLAEAELRRLGLDRPAARGAS